MSAASLLSPSTVTQSTGTNVSATESNPYADLTSSDFVKIMLSELSNQDPFKPNDSAALLEQMSSLRNIESGLTLQDSLKSLVLQNSIGQAGALIGKTIKGLDGEGKDITGKVTSVRIADGKAVLELDSGTSLALERVTSVANPTEAAPTPTPTVTTPTTSIPTGSTTGTVTAGSGTNTPGTADSTADALASLISQSAAQ